MLQIRVVILALAIIATGCASPSAAPPGPAGADTPVSVAQDPPRRAAASPTAGVPSAKPGSGVRIRCMDGALLVEDVSIPDGTDMDPQQPFTKTWRLRNTGTCTWDASYQLVFASGDPLGAPEAVPLAPTPPGGTLDLSVPLAAPPGKGAFAALFELHAPGGEVIPVGKLKNIWVRITVGGGPELSAGAATAVAGTPPAPRSRRSGNCQYDENDAYVQELANLINAARKDAKLPPFRWDSRLATSAQAHSVDMGCHNFLNHTGSDGSWIGDRLAKAGYSTYNYSEIIAIGSPEAAMNQWRNSPSHWDSVLDASLTEFGIGYVYVADSDYGGYFTVDIAKP